MGVYVTVLSLVLTAQCVSVSPVQKVVQLLDELKTKVQNELTTEEKLMGEYTQWCDEEANEKEDAITSSKRTISDLGATIEDAKATIADATSTIESLTTKISASEQDLQKATDLRSSGRTDFEGAEKELVDTVDSLSRATSVLKKNMALVQSGQAATVLKSMAKGLSQIVEASWANSRDKAVIQSLLQSQSSAEDEDLSLQPQATAASYESKSGGILDTIADMQSKAEESLSSTRKDEMTSQHEFAMLKQGLEDELKVMKKQLGEATLERSSTAEELHNAEETLSTTQKTLAADAQYLEELKSSCSVKAAQWSERQKSAAEEQEAIAKAKDILETGVKVFLQTSTVTAMEDVSARARVVSVLKRLATQYKSFALTELSHRATSDPFGKVRALIDNMIAKLMKDAAEESDQKAFCDEELGESRAKQADLTQKMDTTSVRIEKAEAGKAKLSEEIRTLEAEVAEIDAGQAQAIKIRQEERADYEKASKDFRDSAAAVAKAIDVLDNYYSKGAFVQVRARTMKAGQPDMEFGGAKSDVGGTITSMLEVAESDFTRLLAEAEAEENAAQTSFDKLTQENAVTKATKQGDAKGKKAETKQLETALLNYKEDHAGLTKELDAVLTYLDKLKPQCETKVMSYAERKGRRETEIQGLKEALEILSGDGVAFAQTGAFLQRARRS